MIISELWPALRRVGETTQRVVLCGNDASGVVVFGTGVLDFAPGNFDVPAPGARRADRLSGLTTWLYSDREYAHGVVPGLGGPVPGRAPFDPDEPDKVELVINRSQFGVTVTIRLPFGSTTFEVQELGDTYVGLAGAVGGAEKVVYVLSFPGRPGHPPA